MDRYTLAVGRAPFHAAKREDIYRKLKAREYAWPDLAKFSNEITDDLRDIVSLLLVHEDDRPTPDQIVSHPFFRLGHIPLQLEGSCTSRIPKWPKIRPPTAITVRRGYTDEWYALCKSSAVGEYEPGKTFGAYGSRRNKTVARDCQKEIESGKQPNVPFAKDTVYLPFPERTRWPFQAGGGLSEISEEKESSSEGQALVETTGNDRAHGRPIRNTKVYLVEAAPPTLKENKEPTQNPETVRRIADKPPTRMRSARKISNPDRKPATTLAAPVPIRAPKPSRDTVQRTKSAREVARENDSPAVEIQPFRVTKAAPRAVQASGQLPAAQHPRATKLPSTRTISSEYPSSDRAALLDRLYTFRDNVERAVQKKPSISSQRKVSPVPLPYVSKWVDYSRKHGVGYVLDDGSIGCLANPTENDPLTIALVRDGYPHLLKLEKDIEHLKNIPIEYYASPSEEKGISRVEMVDKNRDRIVRGLWKRFGTYMCMRVDSQPPPVGAESAPLNFVRFYQRLGNVGIWNFVDGSFQVGTLENYLGRGMLTSLAVQLSRSYETGHVERRPFLQFHVSFARGH